MKTKYLLLVSIIITLIIGQFSIAFAFDDADQLSPWAEKEYEEARSLNLVIDGTDENYRANITRGLFCKLIVNMIEERMGKSLVITIENPFSDTDEEDIIKAYQLGVVNGTSETTFNPEKEITRQEMAIMLIKAANKLDELTATKITVDLPIADIEFNDEDEISDWALEYVKKAYAIGILGGVGDNKINPLGFATTEQSVALVKRLFNLTIATELSPENDPEITISNFPPVSLSKGGEGDFLDFTVQEQTQIIINTSDLATDRENDPLSFVSVECTLTNPYGIVTLTPAGEISYISSDIIDNIKPLREPIMSYITDGINDPIPVVFSILIEADQSSPNIMTHVVEPIGFELTKKETLVITKDDIINQGLAGDPRVTLNPQGLRITEVVSDTYGRIFPDQNAFTYTPDESITSPIKDRVTVTFTTKDLFHNRFIYFDVIVYFDITV